MLKCLSDREDMGITNRSAAAMTLRESEHVLSNLTAAGLDISQDSAYQALGLNGIDDYYRIEKAPELRMAIDKLSFFYLQVEKDEDLDGVFHCNDSFRHRYYPLLAQIASHLQPTTQLAVSGIPLPPETNHTNNILIDLRHDAHQLTLRIAKAEIGQEELLSWINDTGQFLHDLKYKPTDTLRQTFSSPRFDFLDLK